MKTIITHLLFAFSGFVATSQADTLRESYTAVLSEDDHLNSSGQRLSNAAAIIRQDRANFHKFGKRDVGDQADRFFSSAANRDLLERYLNRGTSEASALRKIVNGTPTVTVQIYQDEAGNDYINVIVQGNETRISEIEDTDHDVLLETYTAALSEDDHLNSSGQRLGNAAAIIRQDRANFHKFGKRDVGDQADRFFASAANRDILEKLLNRGKSNPAVLRRIVNGTPVVTVHVYRTSTGENYIEVFVGE